MSAVILIAGLTASGKTTLAHRLVSRIQAEGGTCALMPLDDYYRDQAEVDWETRCATNYDRPEAFDVALLLDQIRALRHGVGVRKPRYDFSHHTRALESDWIEPADALVVEGQFALHWPELRALASRRVFVETDPEICLQRRMLRDTLERGRDPQEVEFRFRRDVLPAFSEFIQPSRAFAEVVVPGDRCTRWAEAELGRAYAGV